MAAPDPRDQRKPPPSQPNRDASWKVLVPIAVMLVGVWVAVATSIGVPRPAVDYSVFYGWLEAGKVESVVIDGLSIDGTLTAPQSGASTTQFQTVRPDGDQALLPLLRDKKVRIRVTNQQVPLAGQVSLSILPWILVAAAGLWIARRTPGKPGSGPLTAFVKAKSHKFDKSSAAVRFDEVAGQTSAKRDLQEVVDFLKQPERFQRLGGKVPRGVLLVGPPGTGKTLLARAVAGESGVPFFRISGSEFVEMFVGVGAARVRDLFQQAKQEAPAIVFIDEIDAVGRSRGAGLGGGNDEREQTLNQLLSEMDGFDRNDLIVVIAATNRPDVLDPALLRPGRFDRHVVVDRPERSARRAILDVHAKNKPLAPDVDLDAVARDTSGFSGADLANLANEAALRATRRGADAIGACDFAEAFDKIVLGDPREGKLGAEEKTRVAVHESGHAVVARFTSDAEPVQRVTILPRGLALGVTQQAAAEERHILTEPQITSRLRVLMGGYASERIVFGTVSSGAENDLKEATKLASKMVAQYGMSDAFGPVYYEHELEHPFLGRRLAAETGTSDATTHAIEDETRKVLARALDEACHLVTEHRREIDSLTRALIDRETLEVSDLRVLLGPAVDSNAPGAPAMAASVSSTPSRWPASGEASGACCAPSRCPRSFPPT
jgi:cell division protease FtsH